MTLPSANVGLLLRPTLSLPLFIQQACRVLTPVEGKKAIIIDYVGNVFRHGMPTMDRDWSLKKKVKEYDNENDDGTLKIRVCKECFNTFEGGDVCPYCGSIMECDTVNVGIGYQQCGPYHCKECGASEIHHSDTLELDEDEQMTGFYKNRISPIANTCCGHLVSHVEAKRLYKNGSLDNCK